MPTDKMALVESMALRIKDNRYIDKFMGQLKIRAINVLGSNLNVDSTMSALIALINIRVNKKLTIYSENLNDYVALNLQKISPEEHAQKTHAILLEQQSISRDLIDLNIYYNMIAEKKQEPENKSSP